MSEYLHSPIGVLEFVYLDNEIARVNLLPNSLQQTRLSDNPITEWYQEYFFNGPINPPSPQTISQWLSPIDEDSVKSRVLLAMSEIPLGETASYKDIAIKAKTGPRVVGHHCRNNRWPVLFPCHRIIKADDKIGFYLGTNNKIKNLLLVQEKNKCLSAEIK